MNLETTILLALVVFLLMVTETMPPTPDAIPVLGKVVTCQSAYALYIRRSRDKALSTEIYMTSKMLYTILILIY